MRIKDTNKNNHKIIIISLAIVVLLLCSYFLIARANYFWPFKNNSLKDASQNTPATNNTETDQKNNSNTENSSSGIVNTPDQNDENTASIEETKIPTKPSGTFVSNHRPNISGKPYPSSINSTCTTSPGASCEIMFTNGQLKKTLQKQKVNNNGSTYWEWDINNLGLTAGVWKIKAVASNGSLTSETEDPTDLVISE